MEAVAADVLASGGTHATTEGATTALFLLALLAMAAGAAAASLRPRGHAPAPAAVHLSTARQGTTPPDSWLPTGTRPPAVVPAPQPDTALRPSGVHAASALASLCAAVMHAAVVPDHLGSPLTVLFFVAVAAGQVTLAARLLRRPDPLTAIVGVAGTCWVLALWVMSRSVGLPVGSPAEPVGMLDAVGAVLEVSIVGLLVVTIAEGRLTAMRRRSGLVCGRSVGAVSG